MKICVVKENIFVLILFFLSPSSFELLFLKDALLKKISNASHLDILIMKSSHSGARFIVGDINNSTRKGEKDAR